MANAGTAVFYHFFIVRWRLVPAWPVDGRICVGGKRLFGDNKTVFGSAFMLLLAVTVGCLQAHPLLGFLMGTFTVLGTWLNSFIKRRLRIPQGKSFLLDHVDYALSVIVGLSLLHRTPLQLNPLLFLGWVFFFQFSVNTLAELWGFRPTSRSAIG